MSQNKDVLNMDVFIDTKEDKVFKNIYSDIKNISDILTNIYNAVLTLDDSKWNTKEKKIIKEEFMPYLKKLSIKYPNYLYNYLNLTKSFVKDYKENDKNQLVEAKENL